MQIRTFDDFRDYLKANPKPEHVMVRCDLNIPSDTEDLSRIIAVKDTISAVLSLGLKVILTSHYKRPKESDFFTERFSLEQVVEKLSEVLKSEVDFIPNSIFNLTKQSIKSDITLLENLRFYPGEKSNDSIFAQELAKLADIYINDAFSVSHRAHASVEAITKWIPSFSGLNLEKEIKGIECATANISKPYTAIIGGSKISSKIDVLKEISQIADTLIIAGAMANTFLTAQGYKLGTSLIEEDYIQTAKEIYNNSKAKIVLPSDFLVSSDINTPGTECSLENVENDVACFDIGKNSVEKIKKVLSESKTLLWNGALGAFEFANFDKSSNEISTYIADLTINNGLTSVIGGGETIASIGSFKEKMTFVSTAGGAFLEFIAGYDLPGIVALLK